MQFSQDQRCWRIAANREQISAMHKALFLVAAAIALAHDRPHSALGDQTPKEFAASCAQAVLAPRRFLIACVEIER